MKRPGIPTKSECDRYLHERIGLFMVRGQFRSALELLNNIAELFANARKHAPCMLFFDELDAMVPRRDGKTVGHHYASEVNEFLVLFAA